MKEMVETQFELYMLEKNNEELIKILSKNKSEKDEMLQCSFFFLLFIPQFLGILFLSDWFDKHISSGAGVLSVMIGITSILFLNVFCLNKIRRKLLSKKIGNIEDIDVKKMFKQHYYSYFLEQTANTQILDLSKLKYSREQFETLILSSKNKLPTYAEVLAFDEKYEYLQEEKYKVNIHNIKKEKILNLV